MIGKTRWFIVFSWIWICLNTGLQADIQVTAELNKAEIAMNDTAVLTVSIEGVQGGVKPIIPDIVGVKIYSSGTSQSISFINGQMSASNRYLFVLSPEIEGVITIPEISVEYQGVIYKSKSLTMNVVAKTQTSPMVTKSDQITDAERTFDSKELPEVFVESKVDTKECFVHQPITFIFRFYRRVRLLDRPAYIPPSNNGFWVEDLPPEKHSTVNINGSIYEVAEIRSAFFPTVSGELEIGQATLECQIRSNRRVQRDPLQGMDQDPFSVFSQDPFGFFGEKKVLQTDPILLQVKPFPEDNQPVEFDGAVGRFEIKVHVDKTTAKVNDPMSLYIEIFGEGNPNTIPDVDMDLGSNFRVIDSGSSMDITKENYKVKGIKKWEKILVPLVEGDLLLPEISFSYFDPWKGIYRKAASEPIQIKVLPGSKNDTIIDPAKMETNKVKMSQGEATVDFIVSSLNGYSLASYHNIEQFFGLGFLLPPVVGLSLLGGVLLGRIRRRLSGNLPAKKARILALKALKNLEFNSSLSASKTCHEIEKIVLEYLHNRVGLDMSIPLRELAYFLVQKNVSEVTVRELVSYIEQCRFMGFSTLEISKKDFEDLLGHLMQVVKRLDHEIMV